MKIGVVTFPGSLDDRDAARAVRASAARPSPSGTATPTSGASTRSSSPAASPTATTCAAAPSPASPPSWSALVARGPGRPAGPRHLQRLPGAHREPPAARRADPQRPPQVQLRRPPARRRERLDRLDLRLRDGPGDHHRPQERRGRFRRRRQRTLDELEGEGRVVVPLRRPRAGRNPNGSYRDIAGITNERGNVVGLMPHPEHGVEEGYGPSTDGLGFFTSVLKQIVSRMSTTQTGRPAVDTVEPRRRDARPRAAVDRARPQAGRVRPASARSSAAARRAPSSPCTPSCGASTAPTSRARSTSGTSGENTTDEMREKLLVGIGENAGVVDIGDGWAVTFKVESHNHPSYVEPYQGAATGVGGIVRDIMSMGARPIAVMDPLRFGNLHHPDTQRVLPGVVAGVGGYGNCLGLPNIGGEVVFDDCYQGNPLVNALVRRRDARRGHPPRQGVRASATRSSSSAPRPAATASAASRSSPPRPSRRAARPSAPPCRSATRSPRRCSSSAASTSTPRTSSTASRTSAAPGSPVPPASSRPTATAACRSSSTSCRCATPRSARGDPHVGDARSA